MTMSAGKMLNAGYKVAFPYFMVPKEVKIRNHRLSMLHRILLAGTLVFVIWLLTSGQNYLKIEEPTGSVAFWIEAPEELIRSESREDFSSEKCMNTAGSDYLYGSGWNYVNYSCSKLHKYDMYRKEGDGALFFATAFEESSERVRLLPSNLDPSDPDACSSLNDTCDGEWKLDPAGSGAGAAWTCTCEEKARHFAVGFESISFGIEHSYAMTREANGALHSRQSSGSECESSEFWVCDYGAHNMTTVVYVRRQDGQEHFINGSKFDSPEEIRLHLSSVLAAAGFSLDSPNTQTKRNLLRCGTPGADPATCRDDVMEYPTLRITGMELRISMKYFNAFFMPNYPEIRDHQGPSCVIIMTVIPKWSSRQVVDCEKPQRARTRDSDCVSRYYYGVAVSISTSGSFAFLDALQIMLAIGAALSYFALPFQIVHFIAMKCLGPLSKFYEQSSDEELRLDNEIVSCMTQSLSSAASFRVLCAGDKGITKEKVLAEINAVFQTKDDFSLSEQAHLAELVWDRLSRKSDDVEGEEDIVDAEKTEVEAPVVREDMIGLSQFVQSLASRTLSPEVLKLFNRKRCMNPLEHIFIPKGQLKVHEVFARHQSGGFDEDELQCQIHNVSEAYSGRYASHGSEATGTTQDPGRSKSTLV